MGLGSGWHKIEQNPVHRWLGRNVTDGDELDRFFGDLDRSLDAMNSVF